MTGGCPALVSTHSMPSRFFVLHLSDQGGAIGRTRGGDDIHTRLCIFVAQQLLPDLVGQCGIGGCDSKMLVSAETEAREISHADDGGEHRGHAEGRHFECATAHGLEVFTPGNQATCYASTLPPTVWMKISSSDGSTSSKR